MDLLAMSALAKKKDSTPTPAPAGNLLSLLLLTGALNGGGGGGIFGNSGGGGIFGNSYYDEYGNVQDPAKKAILLSGLASGSVSPLTAVAMDRNPGMSTTDSLVVSALGNNPLTSLLVLNQAPGQGFGNGGSLFGNGGGLFGNQRFGSYDNGYYNSGNGILGGGGVLPALVVASAVGGSGGLGTLLALDALGGRNNNNGGFYNGGYYNGGVTNGGFYNGGVVNGGFYNGGVVNGGYYNNGGYFGGSSGLLGNVGNSLNNIFG
jgi:nuclear pore complex protein Nup98-Nup96